MLTSKSCLIFLLASLISMVHGGMPENPELVQRSLAAANMKRFSEKLLHDALLSNSQGKSDLSREQLQRLLETPEGQEAARAAALNAMLEQAPSSSSERSRDGGWLGGMCDTMPWLSWLMSCDENNAVEGREGTEMPPYLVALQHAVWATCPDESNEVHRI